MCLGKLTEWKLLLPSPFASTKAQSHLVKESDCKVFLHGEGLAAVVTEVLSQSAQATTRIQVPKLSDWLFNQQLVSHYVKPIDKNDPWLVFHTSGTTGKIPKSRLALRHNTESTGLPKLITYTHGMMASLEAEKLMPDSSDETMTDHFAQRRWYTPLPSLHVSSTVSNLGKGC